MPDTPDPARELSRLIELLAESLIRQDGLAEAVRQLADQLVDVRHQSSEQHAGLERVEALLSQLHQRLDHVEHRQDRQEKILLHLLELFAQQTGASVSPEVLRALSAPPPRALPGGPTES